MKRNTIMILLLTMVLSVFAQIKRSINDPISSIVYNNFRTDSSQTEFRMVTIDRDLVYNKPSMVSDVIYSLSKGMFLQIVTTNKNFSKIKLLSNINQIVTGWVKNRTIESEIFYGFPLDKIIQKDSINAKFEEKKRDPQWLKQDYSTYQDSLLQTPKFILKKGDLVFVQKEYSNCFKIIWKNKVWEKGFIIKKALSPLYISKQSGEITNFESLFKRYSTALLQNDLDFSAFTTYHGVVQDGLYTKKFVENKKCVQRSTDTLSYRSKMNYEKLKIHRYSTTLSFQDSSKYASYIISENHPIITRLDTLSCTKLTLIHKPLTAYVESKGEIYGKNKNIIEIVYIYTIPQSDNNIIVQREKKVYNWTYQKSISDNKYQSEKYNLRTVLKRLTTFHSKQKE